MARTFLVTVLQGDLKVSELIGASVNPQKRLVSTNLYLEDGTSIVEYRDGTRIKIISKMDAQMRKKKK